MTDVADLYALAPAEFTAARNVLVKALKAQGMREEAQRVAGLRRPPATAWALNRIARDAPNLVTEVADAGRRLRRAMEDALGGDAGDLRDAQVAQRAAVEAAVSAAIDVLARGGHATSDRTRQLLAGTLRASTVDTDAADRLRSGTLDRDHEASGFGLESLTVSTVAPPRPRPAATRAPTAGATAHPPAETTSTPTPPPPAETTSTPTPPTAGETAPPPDELAIERERRQAAARHVRLVADAERHEARAERLRIEAATLAQKAADAARIATDARRAADEATPR